MKKTVKQKPVKYCSKAKLLERSWTAGAIARWLGEPDDYADNPHLGGADIWLYSLTRVARAEAKSDWKAWREQMDKRRAAHPTSGAKAVATKLRIIQEYVDGIKITLPTLTKEELTRNACDHYNSLHFEDGKYAQRRLRGRGACWSSCRLNGRWWIRR
jgi:hypothetical protein